MLLKILRWITAMTLLLISFHTFALNQVFVFNDVYEINPNTTILDFDDTGGNVILQFGSTLAEQIYWNSSTTTFVFTDDVQVQGTLDVQSAAEAIEVGLGTATDNYINFDDGANHDFGWDDSEDSLATFNEQLVFRTRQSANPPLACSSTVAGMQWMDTDNGILYICDPVRNKWLSTTELAIFGENTGSCGVGANIGSSSANCAAKWGANLGGDTNTDLGLYIPNDITITAGGFSADDNACTGGTFDVEIWSTNSATDDNNFSLYATIAAGLTGEALNSNALNVDVDGGQYILWGIENNCGFLQNIDDWNLILYYRWRHD